jgi:hypothetical protein
MSKMLLRLRSSACREVVMKTTEGELSLKSWMVACSSAPRSPRAVTGRGSTADLPRSIAKR